MEQEIMVEQRVNKLLTDMYNAYGSGTGVLFGIPSNLKSSVHAVIKLVLEAEGNKNAVMLKNMQFECPKCKEPQLTFRYDNKKLKSLKCDMCGFEILKVTWKEAVING